MIMYAKVSWALACSLLMINAAALSSPKSYHKELMQNAPPGITYTVLKGINSYARRSSSSSKDSRPASSRSKSKTKQSYIQKLQPIRTSRTNSRSVAAILGAHQRQVAGSDYGYENITSTNVYGTQYATSALWDGNPIKLLLDTGSSDTWAVQDGYECVDYLGETLPQVSCAFGPAQPTSFRYGLTNPKTHMYIQYGDGEVVKGPMGFSSISVGNLTVKKQQVSLATQALWYGNNMTSGLLGMAFPALTNAFLGDDDDHSPGNTVEYSPFFTTLIEQGDLDPTFSIAIDRNASTGILALGGVPPVTGLDRSKVAALDLIITNLIDSPITSYQYSFYTIIPDGWYFDQTTTTKKYPYIIDSGTTLCYLPPAEAQMINSAFDPPARYMPTYNAFFTSCDARTPPGPLAIILNGIKFSFNPRDLIYRNMPDPVTGLCMTAIASGGSQGGPYILGDAFMQNALVVFDLGEAKIRVTGRMRY